MKLSPRQVNAVASAICGGPDMPIAYRTGAEINSFIEFVGIDVTWEPGSSRFYDAQAFVEACNAMPSGRSGLPAGIEQVLIAIVDRREFEDDERHQRAVEHVRGVLARLPISLEVNGRGEVELRSTHTSRGQEIVEREIHTVFGQALDHQALEAARVHMRKARRLRSAAEPDYANATKEAVCAIESIAVTLTGERDLIRAIAKSVRAGIVPAPLGEMIKKLYAYRGDEPGVAHANATVPNVDAEDAAFAVNMAAVVGLYLRDKLAPEP